MLGESGGKYVSMTLIPELQPDYKRPILDGKCFRQKLEIVGGTAPHGRSCVDMTKLHPLARENQVIKQDFPRKEAFGMRLYTETQKLWHP